MAGSSGSRIKHVQVRLEVDEYGINDVGVLW